MNPVQAAVLRFATQFVSFDIRLARTAFGGRRRAAALFVILAATIPAIGQAPQSSGDSKQTGSIHGTISTTQENAPSGLAGISVQLTMAPPDGNTLTADTDDAGRYEFKGIRPGSGKIHHIRLGFYSLNVTNHGNFNAVFNNVTAPNFGQFVGFLDRRDGAVIDFID
jgi:hypothetical protein